MIQEGNQGNEELEEVQKGVAPKRSSTNSPHPYPHFHHCPPSLALNKFHWHLVNFYFCGTASTAFLAAGPICRPAARCLGGGGVCVNLCVFEGLRGEKHTHISREGLNTVGWECLQAYEYASWVRGLDVQKSKGGGGWRKREKEGRRNEG